MTTYEFIIRLRERNKYWVYQWIYLVCTSIGLSEMEGNDHGNNREKKSNLQTCSSRVRISKSIVKQKCYANIVSMDL